MAVRLLSKRAVVMARKQKTSQKKSEQQSEISPELTTLAEVASSIAQCRACKLCETRIQTVPGEGSAEAELVFVGEAPGTEDDAAGKTFLGPSGQLLTKMIEALGLSRDQVFLLNLVKCRPPENRNPDPSEIEACFPYFLGQLDLLKPKVVVALGQFTSQILLKTKTPITELRGNFYDYRGNMKLMPTFHPEYLLRSPGSKKSAWEDLKKVAAEIGINVPKVTDKGADKRV